MDVKIAVLWDREIDFETQDPMDEKSLTETYEEFSEIAEKRGGKVFLSNYRYFHNGKLDRAVTLEEGKWSEVSGVEVDSVYDKYKFESGTKQLKKDITEKMHVINQFGPEEICKDKLLTYQKFEEIVPETRIATERNVEKMLSNNAKVVLKPRYDYGGKGVELIETIEEFNETENQLAQAFVDSSSGYEELGVEGVHDLRILVINGSPEAAYFRLANEGFISNVSMGGSMKFVELEKVPDKALEIVENFSETLDKWNPSFYSVDMVFDTENEPHVLELNSKPGLNFYGDEEVRKWKKPVMVKLIDKLLQNP